MSLKRDHIRFKTGRIPGAFLLLVLPLAAGCLSNNLDDGAAIQAPEGNTDGTNGTGSQSGGTVFKIANVNIVESGDQGGEAGTASIFFDSDATSRGINQFCNVSQTESASPCVCKWEWTEINELSGTKVQIPRIAETQISTAQEYLVICSIPPVFTSEIADGTLMKLSVAPTAGTSGPFSMKAHHFIKSPSDTAPDFRDEVGRGFVNIHRFSCHERISRGMTIRSRLYTARNDNSGKSVQTPLATQFCFRRNSGDGGGSGDGCAGVGGTSFSAQGGYFNLYRPSPSLGLAGITENERYSCPRVKEALLSTGGSISGQGSPWPLDATFALALQPGETFTVGVEAPAAIGLAAEPLTAPNTCFPGSEDEDGDDDAGGVADPGSISSQCLGYALQPKADGTCPSFTDDKGQIRMTYRLRRYIAFYPPMFDTNGEIIAQAHAVDSVLVLDRPVKSGNPLRPYTMRGPLPCNFAAFDHSGVLGDDALGSPFVPNGTYGTPHGWRPAYKGTNSSYWADKSVDGLSLPNSDQWGTNQEKSCAALLPIIHFGSSQNPIRLTFGTSSGGTEQNPGEIDVGGRTIKMKKVWIRPARPWWPHYVEDSEFEACAPMADPFRDPPLHFAKASDGTVRWCAEAYPTQNDNIDVLDRKRNAEAADVPPGFVKPFTSHAVKHSNSAACSYTSLTLPDGYPASSLTAPRRMPDNQSPDLAAVTAAAGSQTWAPARHPEDLIIDRRLDGSSGTESIGSDRTCDRTVVSPHEWKHFPLLAEPEDVENMLKADSAFACQITWDDGNGKAGRTTPAEGCCATGTVKMRTGGTVSATNANSAHLETDVRCQAPNY